MASALSIAMIDDNQDDSEAMSRQLQQLDDFEIAFQHYEDADSGLKGLASDQFDLVFLDYRLEGQDQDGLSVLERADQAGVDVPFIMLTGHGDEYVAADSIRHGAADYLIKGKCDLERLRQSLDRVVKDAESRRRQRKRRKQIKDRLATLTTREREVLDALIAGKTSKQIAGDFYRSEQTIKIHRANLMRKMGAGTPAEVTRMVVNVRRPMQ